MQDLWKRALSGGKNSCREVMVAQKLFPMQAMQQIFEVSGHPSYYEVHTLFYRYMRFIYIHKIFVFTFSLDTYMSHEGVIYCKPHHKELFQPKAVIMDILDDKRDAKAKKTQDIIGNCLYSFRVKYLLLIKF